MVIIFALGGLVVLSFVIGIAFLFKSQNDPSSPGDGSARRQPADDTKGLDAVLGQEAELKQQLEKMSGELKETQEKLAKAKEAEEEVAYLRVMEKEEDEKIKKLGSQIEELTVKAQEQAAGACEVIRRLEGEKTALTEQFGQLRGKADELSQGSLAAITALKQQIKDLEAKSGQGNQQPAAEFDRIKNENQALHTEVEKLLAQVNGVGQQLPVGSEVSSGELSKARETIDQLSAESNRLKAILDPMTAKIAEVSQEFFKYKASYEKQLTETREAIDRLTEEKNQLERQTVSADEFNDMAAELYKVKEEKDRLSAESAARIAQYEADINNLRAQIDANQAKMTDLESRLVSGQVELSKHEVVAGVSDSPAGASSADGATVRRLVQEKNALEKSLAELRQVNQELKEEEQMIYDELAKVKMKALGLEKMCEGMKERLEAQG